MSTRSKFWPKIGASVPFPTADGSYLSTAGAEAEMSNYLFQQTQAGNLLSYDPLGSSYAPENVEHFYDVRFNSSLSSSIGEYDNQVITTVGGTTVGDGAEGIFCWVSGSTTTTNNGTVFGNTTSGRWKRQADQNVLNVRWFGAKGDGVTDDTSAINTALAALSSGGTLYFPPGSYLVKRGTGSALSDNIAASNVTIMGDGASSIITSMNAAGATPNNAGNEYYNVFQATSRSGLTFRGLTFTGYATPISLFSCSDVTIENVRDSALLSNAGGYLRNKTFYLYKCSNVAIAGCYINNSEFGVYLSGDNTTRTRNVLISGCTIEQTVAAGSFTGLFPTGVYAYYADDVVVSGCSFKDIYSSLDAGTTGTGVGYGVYEGDGACNQILVTGCSFRWAAKGSKNAYGVYFTRAKTASAIGNTFYVESGARVSALCRMNALVSGVDRVFSGNIATIISTTINTYGAYATETGTVTARVVVANNLITGGYNGFRIEGMSGASVDISGNTFSDQFGEGVRVAGESATYPLRFPMVRANRISGSYYNGIYFAGHVISPQVTGNVVLDGNTSNTASDAGAAILFSTYSFGSLIVGNTIGNTAFGGGLFTYGIQNASNASDRIFKDIVANNTFVGLANNFQLGRYWTSSPTNGVFDASKGDFFANVQLDTAEAPGWYVALVLTPTLTADASSASTTVTVNSTSSMAAGQVVLICKDSNPYDGDFADTTKWHVDTVSSVTDATHFVLTTGIPAGDGTYSTGSAVIKVVGFKAAAVIS